MAFYHAVLRVASKLDVPVHIIAVEKKEPYRCGVWEISIESLDFARAENERAMETLRYCQLANRWPTGYEGGSYLRCGVEPLSIQNNLIHQRIRRFKL